MSRLRWVAVVLVLAAACGGGGGGDPVDAPVADAAIDAALDAAVPPVFRNPVDLADLPLAQQAAALLGEGGVTNCDACHGLTRTRLREWDTLTDAGAASCLGDLAPTTPAAAMAIVSCLRDPTDQQFRPGRLGINATAGEGAWFEYLFRLAHGAAWEAPFADWKDRVRMPRGDHPPFTQAEFDVVAEWFARGLPQLDAVIPSDPVPPPCTTEITPAIAAHVTAMQTGGWRTLNRDDGLLMFGCQGAATPRDCLGTYPLASTQPWAAGWAAAAPAQQLRILRELAYDSAFWTRSSADGRFVAHGGGPTGGSTVIDLMQGREIRANASYDPGFFPDNSGFVLQGGGAHYCDHSLLTSSPASISFSEPQCRTFASVGLYQHLGAVRGGDYWTVHGQYSSDNGGINVTGSDPGTGFSGSATNTLTPMIHDGTTYVARPAASISTPYEGDMEMSPSSRLLISRTGTSGGNGFVVRAMQATPTGNGYTVTAPIVGRYCVRGGKPGFSYDERWLTYHHYVGANDWQELGYASASDAGFVALRAQGAANTYVLDLLTGEARRVTTMGPGQYALFPHFRSDGWLYIQVRDRIRDREYVVASDVALVYEQP